MSSFAALPIEARAVRFDARNLTLESEPLAPRAGLAAWAAKSGATRVVDWAYSTTPKLETAPGQLRRGSSGERM